MTEQTSLITKQYRGSGFMTIAKYNNNGNFIYVGDKESKLIIAIDTNTYSIVGTFNGHNGVIWSLDLTKDDNKLVSCSGDMSIIIWNALTGNQIKKLIEQGIPKSISIQKNGLTNYAVVLCESISKRYKSYVVVYNLDDYYENINENQDIEPIYKLNWEEESKPTIVLWLDEQKILIGTDNGTIYIKNILDKESDTQYKFHDGAIKSIVFNKTRTNILTSSTDMTSKQIDLETWEVIKVFQSKLPINYAIFNYNDRKVILAGGIEAMLISKSVNSDLNIKFYRTADQKLISQMSSHFGPVRYIDKAPTGQNFLTASQDGTVKIYLFDGKNDFQNDKNNYLFGNTSEEDLEMNSLILNEEINTIEYLNSKAKDNIIKPEPKRIVGMPPLKNNNNNNNNNNDNKDTFKINKDNENYNINDYKLTLDNSTIRINNLPNDIDYNTLLYYFDCFGRIEDKGIRIKSYSDNTMAFIKYYHSEDALKAIDYMHKKPIDHCIIHVELSKAL